MFRRRIVFVSKDLLEAVRKRQRAVAVRIVNGIVANLVDMAVYWANARGIVHGYEASNGFRYYRPWVGVTREQVAAMLVAHVEGEPGSVSDFKGFSDWSSSSS